VRKQVIARKRIERAAVVGVAEHGNSAILVTVARGGELLDRRRIDLTRGLPTQPYHHEGAWAVGRYLSSPWAQPVSLADAVALVERVHAAAALRCEDIDAFLRAMGQSIGPPWQAKHKLAAAAAASFA
jgi:hypothetical protein